MYVVWVFNAMKWYLGPSINTVCCLYVSDLDFVYSVGEHLLNVSNAFKIHLDLLIDIITSTFHSRQLSHEN